MTLLEVVCVTAVATILILIYLASLPKHWARAPSIQCINNVKQAGLATRVWEGDHNDRYPSHESVTNGGSMEYITGPNVWHHFQVMSNELSTPKVVVCPADAARFYATNFEFFGNSNVSFFFGVDATETIPGAFLVGDRNLTNGLPLKNAVMELATNQSPRWTREMHETYGNIGLADGSVRQVYPTNMQVLLIDTDLATNRLQMPVLTP